MGIQSHAYRGNVIRIADQADRAIPEVPAIHHRVPENLQRSTFHSAAHRVLMSLPAPGDAFSNWKEVLA